MPEELILHFILYHSPGTNKHLLSRDVSGDVEDLHALRALEEEKVGGEISNSCVC